MLNKKIKILYFITSSQMGGAEKMLYELSKRINKSRFKILVCTIKNEDGQLLKNLEKVNIQTKTLNLNSKWQFFKVFKLIKIIKEFNPDILQSFLFFDNILARIFGKLWKVPIIISGQRNVEIYRSFLRNFLDKITLPLTDFVISNTKAGKKFLIEKGKVSPVKILVIPNGVDLTKIPSSLKKEERNRLLKEILPTTNHCLSTKIIGFVGFLSKQKGVEYLLKAFSFLKKELKKRTFLVIIGDGPIKNNLEKFSRKLNIENRVYFLGHKKEAINYMPLFDVFCLPSLWEGLPNVLLEAMACQVPVIGTRVGGVPEIIENRKNGFLVEPKNPKMLAEKISYVLSLTKEKRKEIGKEGRERIRNKFSLGKMIGAYENLYKNFF